MSVEQPGLVGPLARDHRLLLGSFGSNDASYGMGRPGVALSAREQWPETLFAVQAVDRMGLEVIVSVSTWPGNSFDTQCWAAAVAAVTEQAMIFATTDMGVVHPVKAAKQLATVDHVSGGRAGANVVAGWREAQAAAFGVDLLEHDRRYDRASEWLEFVWRMWDAAPDDPFRFSGEFYEAEIVKGAALPKPLQSRPPIMNAGSSERSYEFIARYADLMLHPNTQLQQPDDARARIPRLKQLARDHGRQLQVWTYATVCSRDSDAEAQAYRDHVDALASDVREREEELEKIRRETHAYAHLSDEEWRALLARARARPMVEGLQLLGSPDHVVDQMLAFADAGLDGLLLIWPSWREDIPYFQQHILPRLEQAGVRKPHIPQPQATTAASAATQARG